MKKLFSFIILYFAISHIALASTLKVEETRTIEKSFNVNAEATLEIDNRYGNITLTSWNKNTIEIKVEIQVNGINQENAKATLNAISVEFDAKKSWVSAITQVTNLKNFKRNTIKINYFVKVPKSNNLQITNRYGNVYLDEISGSTQFKLSYGNLTAGKLNNVVNNLNLNYMTSAKIDYLKSATILAKYSIISINEAQSINTKSQYSDLRVEKLNELTCNMSFSNLYLTNIDKITSNLDYSNLKITNLYQYLNYNGDYGAIAINRIKKNFNQIIVNGDYLSLNLGIENTAQYSFEADLRYGSIRYPNNLEMSKVIETSSQKHYIGKTAQPSGKMSFNLKYGGIKLNLVK